jgi:hypothetical protein
MWRGCQIVNMRSQEASRAFINNAHAYARGEGANAASPTGTVLLFVLAASRPRFMGEITWPFVVEF